MNTNTRKEDDMNSLEYQALGLETVMRMNGHTASADIVRDLRAALKAAEAKIQAIRDWEERSQMEGMGELRELLDDQPTQEEPS